MSRGLRRYCIQRGKEKQDGWRGAQCEEYCLEATENIKGFVLNLGAIANEVRN